MAAHVVIEVDVDVEAGVEPGANLAYIPVEGGLAVVAAAGRPVMPADVKEVRSDGFGHVRVATVGETKGSPVPFQKFEDRRNQPRRIADLNNRADLLVRLQRGEKDFKTLQIHFEVWRQLEQHRAQAIPQMPGAREEKFERILGILETFDVRQKSAGLYCEREVLRHPAPPIREDFLGGQPI